MKLVEREVTMHRVGTGHKFTLEYTGVFASEDGTKIVARRAPDSEEVSFAVTTTRPNALNERMIERIAEEIARAIASNGVDHDIDLDRPLTELDLSVRTANCLRNSNICLVGQLVQMNEYDILRTKNFNRMSLKEIKEVLANMGLTLGMKLGWTPPGTPAT